MTGVARRGAAIPKLSTRTCDVVLRHHWGQCQREHGHPSCSFLPCAGLPVTLVQLRLLPESDQELLWLKSGHRSPSLLFFFDMDYFSTQLLTWLYKHLHWYHRGQNKGRNGGGCLNHCCGNKYSCNCTRGVPKINRQALRECYHLEPSARAKMNGIRNISE